MTKIEHLKSSSFLKVFIIKVLKKYILEDLDGEEIKGTFYEPKLQLVEYNPDRAFTIEREICSVGVGHNRQILVKWAGWPDKFNSWITEAHYKKICHRK